MPEVVKRVLRTLLALISVLYSFPSAATEDADQVAAQQAAVNFTNGLFDGIPATLYNSQASRGFRRAINLQQFSMNSALFRIQVGGPARNIRVAGSTSYATAPTGEAGRFYFVRVRADYPNGPLFLDHYLSKVGLSWLIETYTVMPAPPYCEQK